MIAQPNQTIDWTDDRIATLKRLWLAGASQANIAADFGVTRNAIAGKISRLKLTRAPSKRQPRKPRPQYPKKPKPEPEPLPGIDRASNPWWVNASDRVGISLLDLRNDTCRWPKGAVGADGFHFCGVPTADLSVNRPYCREHTNLARRT